MLTLALFALLIHRVPAGLVRFREGDWLSGAAAAGIVGLTLRAFFETGSTLGGFQLTDSLLFFLFGMILLGGTRWGNTGSTTDQEAVTELPFPASTSS